jgi:hypothetical protein
MRKQKVVQLKTKILQKDCRIANQNFATNLQNKFATNFENVFLRIELQLMLLKLVLQLVSQLLATGCTGFQQVATELCCNQLLQPQLQPISTPAATKSVAASCSQLQPVATSCNQTRPVPTSCNNQSRSPGPSDPVATERRRRENSKLLKTLQKKKIAGR